MVNTDYKLLSYKKIPSTQTLAAEMIASGKAEDKTVIMAKAQTAGRGRMKRKWVSHQGNLYASFIYKVIKHCPTLSYSFAVAAAETLINLGVPAKIKWPNDLLVDGKKISGLLLEYCHNFLIVGIGINIKTSPTTKLYKTTKTNDYVKGLTPNKIIHDLIKNFEKWRKKDFSVVRTRWTQLAIDMNTPLNYRSKSATYCGLNEDGAMILKIGSKYELIYGDEVFT